MVFTPRFCRALHTSRASSGSRRDLAARDAAAACRSRRRAVPCVFFCFSHFSRQRQQKCIRAGSGVSCPPAAGTPYLFCVSYFVLLQETIARPKNLWQRGVVPASSQYALFIFVHSHSDIERLLCLFFAGNDRKAEEPAAVLFAAGMECGRPRKHDTPCFGTCRTSCSEGIWADFYENGACI